MLGQSSDRGVISGPVHTMCTTMVAGKLQKNGCTNFDVKYSGYFNVIVEYGLLVKSIQISEELYPRIGSHW